MLKELSIEDIHECTLDLIVKLDKLCSEIGVKYYVMYGSLIGAIRHKGFIPWDDDFDVIMMRPDYDRFVAYCREHQAELMPLKLLNKDTTDNYPYNISRFSDTSYRMEKEGVSDTEMGLFIDVYVFDGIGNDPQAAVKKLARKKKIYNLCTYFSYYKVKDATNKGFAYQITKNILFLYAKNKSPYVFFKKFDKLAGLYDYDSSEYIGEIVWDSYITPFRKEWFADTVRVPFESIEVPVPVGYDQVLHAEYGDYMQLPPEDKRVPSHFYKLYKVED
ncbi:MAG: LicD family protein [Clostridiales bacterium]|nr:LicD family protein [Clostridiales bacterium]